MKYSLMACVLILSTLYAHGDQGLSLVGTNKAVHTVVYLSIGKSKDISPSYTSNFVSVDNQTLEKYPVLKYAMINADKRYDFVLWCESQLPNHAGIHPPPTGVTLPIVSDDANTLINDTSFNFKKVSPDLYRALLRHYDSFYSIDIPDLTEQKTMKHFPYPNQQVANGVSSDNVQCAEGLILLNKSSDSTPACVKPPTAEKLLKRGWTTGNSTNLEMSLEKCYRP